MITWSYFNPVKITARKGALDLLPELITNGCWLLVTTAGFTHRGLTKHIQNLLPNTELLIHDQVTPNPELDDLEQVIQKYRKQKIYGILAIGGGSVLDAAKILAVTLPCELPTPLITTLRQGQEQNWSKKLFLVLVPTTSGTGAEVTPFATVWDQSEHKKYSITGDNVFPDQVLLDPELTLTLPKQLTLYTGLDAVSHALESLWNVNRSPVSICFAIQALKLAEKALPLVLKEPSDLIARKTMQEASVLAGMAISHTRTAIAHSISYPLTIHYGVPHGLACSFTLPRLIQVYLIEQPHCAEKALLERMKRMLTDFNLDAHIANYADEEQILALKKKMYHPERAGNFICRINNETLNEILVFSI